METGAPLAPTGVAIEDLFDWRPAHGVVTVCVEIDPSDRSAG
jgi:hypothetical protein